MSFQKTWPFNFLYSLVFILTINTRIAFGQDSIITRIQYVLPSIVEITAKNAMMFRVPDGAFIDKESGQLIQVDSVKAAEYTREGSGVIIDPSGIIVTNAHTVTEGARVEVRLMEGAVVIAQILKIFPDQDLAFLKITPPYPVSRVDMIDSSSVSIDDEVVTVGNSPFLKQTLSGGRVTGVAKHGNPYTDSHPDLLQLNINIYQGDSGGPLFNNKGQMIGLMVAKQGDQDRLCFAIPSNKIIQTYLTFLEEVKKRNEQP
jgi:S1-C subfamily serine protease